MREQRAENARKKTENLMGSGSIDYAQYDIFYDGCFRLQKSGCQGDSILIEAGTAYMLIDAGENNMGDSWMIRE